jgi:predicted transcriptional regulator
MVIKVGSHKDTDLLQVLADDYSREILVAADGEPRTAKSLAESCDASLTTVYRRVSKLKSHGLIEERTEVSPEKSHHRVYETVLEDVRVTVSDGEISVAVETRDELADSFASMWEDMGEEV